MRAQDLGEISWSMALLAGVMLVLSGCGGSGGGSKSPTLSGTAAVGAAIVSGTVMARCSDSSSFTEAVTTDANGRWSGTLTSGVLPCALRVSGGSPAVTLHSYASSAGTVNITPLTDLTLALATGQNPADWFNSFDGTPLDLSAATGELLDALTDAGFSVPSTGNPFATVFAANGSGWDGLLDDLQQAIEDDPALANYDALLALVKDGNLTSVPAAPVPVANMFSIAGSISGATGSVAWQTQVAGSTHHSGSNNNGAVTFTLPEKALEGSVWAVTVTAAPAGQTCSVANGSGTLNANVSNVAITCETIINIPTLYSISGVINGATGAVAWQTQVAGAAHHSGSNNNGAVTFTLPGKVPEGSAWAVTVTAAPAGQTCSVANGAGTLSANISNVAITCQNQGGGSQPTPIYDFSALNLSPSIPTNMVPTAPTQLALDPSDKIANLYAQLGAEQKTKIFSQPSNIVASTVSEIDEYSGSYAVRQTSADPLWVRAVRMSFGVDGLPDTADDYIIAYTVLPSGFQGAQYSFSHPGEDGIWFTEGDIAGPAFNNKVVYFPAGSMLEYEGASEGALLVIPCLDVGQDGIAFTADDSATGCSAGGYQIIIIDGQGNRGQVVSYNNPGPDALWFTADDKVQNYVLTTYNSTGISLGSAVYNSAGADGLWFTEDDPLLQHSLFQLDENYKPLYMATYNLPGNDYTWFTADDVVSAWSYFGYDENGNSVLVANHTNKGSDGVWFTADDHATGVISLKDDNGNVVVSASLSKMGPDGIWLTGDEQLSTYSYAEFDDNNNKIRTAEINNKGADGKWFTADDRPNGSYGYWSFEYDSQNRLLRQGYFDPSLAPTEPAFSLSHVSRYTAYKAGANVIISVNRNQNGSSFGADGLPFTADDSIGITTPDASTGTPYLAVTATGYDMIGQPGPDAIWFTADDVRVGYAVQQYEGQRKVLEQVYDSNDVMQSYLEAEHVSANPYRLNSYIKDGANFVLKGYTIIEEDINGNPIVSIFHNAAGVVTSSDYRELDADGNVVRLGYGYTSGDDGIWGTSDDFKYFYTYSFNSSGEPLNSRFDEPGDDGIWFTADDLSQISQINKLSNSINGYAQSVGSTGDLCADLSSGSGSINLLVRDQNNAPLAGVVVQLNHNGATQTTDANGESSFAGLSGKYDVHLFKDGYSWESFYCVAPGQNVTVKAKLNNRAEQAHSSKVVFNNSTSAYFTLRLLDTNGKSVAASSYNSGNGSQAGQTYNDLYFDLPAGEVVTGELWAFKTNSHGAFLDAVSLGPQSYTTIASNASPLVGDREQISINFNATAPATVDLAKTSKLRTASKSSLQVGMMLGDLYGPVLKAIDPLALAPTLLALLQPSAVVVNSETWSARYPGVYPEMGGGEYKIAINSVFQYAPIVSQQTDSSSSPTISWTPAYQVAGNTLTMNTLELTNAVGGMGWRPHWVIHTPAGAKQVALPNLPVEITEELLPETMYRMALSTRMVAGLDYHDFVGTEDVHQLDLGLTTEVIRSGANSFLAPLLLR